MKIEFIHCGDLHLGHFPNHIEERFQDYFKASMDIVNYAISHKVPFILVSGDFFHLKAINAKTLQHTISLLKRAKEHQVRFFVIEGNHDKAFYVDEDSWLTFLDQQGYITLLRGQIEEGKWQPTANSIFQTEGLRIIGVEYLGGATSKHLDDIYEAIPKSDDFTVVMMHAAIDRLSGQEMGDIRSKDILRWQDKVDYVALGHIHNRYEVADLCYNPGSMENIHIRDIQAKEKGFYHVSVEGKKKDVLYIAAKPRVVHFEKLDMSDFSSPMAAEESILNRKYSFKAGNMASIILYGKTSYNAYLIDSKAIEEALQSKYHLLHIEVENKINIIKNKTGLNEEVNMQALLKTLMEDQLRFYYPEVTDIEEWGKVMMDATELLKEDADFDTIIDHLYQRENKDEN